MKSLKEYIEHGKCQSFFQAIPTEPTTEKSKGSYDSFAIRNLPHHCLRVGHQEVSFFPGSTKDGIPFYRMKSHETWLPNKKHSPVTRCLGNRFENKCDSPPWDFPKPLLDLRLMGFQCRWFASPNDTYSL